MADSTDRVKQTPPLTLLEVLHYRLILATLTQLNALTNRAGLPSG